MKEKAMFYGSVLVTKINKSTFSKVYSALLNFGFVSYLVAVKQDEIMIRPGSLVVNAVIRRDVSNDHQHTWMYR